MVFESHPGAVDVTGAPLTSMDSIPSCDCWWKSFFQIQACPSGSGFIVPLPGRSLSSGNESDAQFGVPLPVSPGGAGLPRVVSMRRYEHIKRKGHKQLYARLGLPTQALRVGPFLFAKTTQKDRLTWSCGLKAVFQAMVVA